MRFVPLYTAKPHGILNELIFYISNIYGWVQINIGCPFISAYSTV